MLNDSRIFFKQPNHTNDARVLGRNYEEIAEKTDEEFV